MNIVYAAEKLSIAQLLGEHIEQTVNPKEIEVTPSPVETGRFLIGWRFKRYVLTPSGEIASDARAELER